MANLQQLLRIGLALAFNPARLMEDAADSARRTAVMLICVLIAGGVLIPAAGCAAAGLWIFVQHYLGPVWAAFITAAALLILAAIILIIGLVAGRRPRRDEDRRRSSSPSAAGSAAAAAVSALPAAAIAALSAPREAAAAGARAGRGFFARHKGTALLAAVVAGLVLGQDMFRPRRRPRR